MLGRPDFPTDVILDTDAYNEVDDQFAIAYLLSNGAKLRVKGINAAPFVNGKSAGPGDGMQKSFDEIKKICKLMKRTGVSVYQGSEAFLPDEKTFIDSEAAENIVKTAKKYSSEKPLYIAAVGAITNIASAILMSPDIIDKIVVVWLGGHAYHTAHTKEYNMFQDVAAARIVFGCGVPFVQLPCAGVVSAFTISEAELTKWLKGKNPVCDYLASNTISEMNSNTPWTRVIWDVTAVAWLLWENYTEDYIVHAPVPQYSGKFLKDEKGRYTKNIVYNDPDELVRDIYDPSVNISYGFNQNNHLMKCVHTINRDLLVADLFKKLTGE